MGLVIRGWSACTEGEGRGGGRGNLGWVDRMGGERRGEEGGEGMREVRGREEEGEER